MTKLNDEVQKMHSWEREVKKVKEFWVLFSKNEIGQYECLKTGLRTRKEAETWKDRYTCDGKIEKVEVYR